MGNLKEKLFGLIDNGASTAMTLFDTVHDTLDSIDWDSQFKSFTEMKDSLVARSNELLSDFNELMKQVKDNLTDFEVSLPFDESEGEKFDYKVDGNKLTLEVTFKDENTERSNKTTVSIPENCDVEKITTRYNSVAKVMSVIIPKIIVERPKDEKKEEKPSGFKLRKPAATPKKTPSHVEEESHDAASKLLKKFRQHSKKTATVVDTPEGETVTLPRGANGRFVKRTK